MQGLKLKMVSQVEGVIDPKDPQGAIVVKAGSPIKAPIDLDGTTVATPSLKGELDLLTRVEVDRAGGHSLNMIRFRFSPCALDILLKPENHYP